MLSHAASNVALPRIVMHTSEPSGLGHYVSAIVLALADAGVSVVLFCPANSSDEAAVRAAGIEVVHASPKETTNVGLIERLWRNVVFLVKSVRIQSRLVRRGDIAHFQALLHLPLGFAFLLLARVRGAKLVLTAHDPLPHRWRLPRWLRWLERGMLRRAYHLCDAVIVHNRTGRNVLIDEFHLPPERVFVVPHGCYEDAAGTQASYPRFDHLSLLAFGSIRENKGLHLAIQAVQAAALKSRLPIRLTIAGRIDIAEAQYWEECKQRIAAKPDAIATIERVIENEEVGPLFARHHAVVLPYTSFFSESGVATLALSHQRPILATTQGGLGELMESGCGISIRSATVQSVEEAILAAVEAGPERLRQMGIEGNQFIRKARSWDFVARQTAKVYSEVGADRSSHAGLYRFYRT